MRSRRWTVTRLQISAAFAAAWALASVAGGAAASETGPVIVVPGRGDVPVVLNGREVVGAVIEGDWGLARPSNINPTVIYRLWPPPAGAPPAKAYFPSSGRPPKFGRKEAESPPSQSPPPQAQEYHQSWSSQSEPLPATIPTPYEMPPVLLTPPEGRWLPGPPRPPGLPRKP